MKILFVHSAFDSLALEYLSAVAKNKGHEVVMVFDPNLFNDSYISLPALARFFSMQREVAAKVISQKPDLIAFSVSTTDFPWFHNIGKLLRQYTSAFMIAGNVHVTAAPEAVLKLGFLDAIVRGEGEQAFADVLDSLEAGIINPDIPNLGLITDGSVRINPLRPLIQNLDDLPLPDKTIYKNTPIFTKEMYSIMASRGCPFDCTFCSNNLMQRLYGKGNYLRYRSVDNVIDELSFAKKAYRTRYVNFYDLTMGANRRWLAEFAEKYPSRIGLPYFISTNPTVVTQEYAELLAVSGCVNADLGVQTINADKRRDIFNRHESNEQIRQAIAVLKQYGIRVHAENIIDYPDETEADLVETTVFYNEVRPDLIKVYWLSYFPGTKIIDIALEKGIFTSQSAADIGIGKQAGLNTKGGALSEIDRKIHLLLIMLPVLPKPLVSFLIRRRLYLFIPTGFLGRNVYLIFRVLLRQKSPEINIWIRQSKNRYIFYLKLWLKSRLRRKATY
jgi:anaerobic magnesium-protoporphyrin IX monomethyl ester cyclase